MLSHLIAIWPSNGLKSASEVQSGDFRRSSNDFHNRLEKFQSLPKYLIKRHHLKVKLVRKRLFRPAFWRAVWTIRRMTKTLDADETLQDKSDIDSTVADKRPTNATRRRASSSPDAGRSKGVRSITDTRLLIRLFSRQVMLAVCRAQV